jgi:hypothetical protein
MKRQEFVWTLKQLDKYKSYFGFADWTVGGVDKTNDDSHTEFVAEADWDITNQKLRVTFFKAYSEFKKQDRINTIIHEFVHARIGIAQDYARPIVEKTLYEFEEQAVNDVVRGIKKVRGI